MSEIVVQSMVSHRTKEPKISIYWPKDVDASQMTPEEARAFARTIFECAEAAQQDAWLFDWATTKIGTDERGAGMLINELREWRGQQRGPE